MQKKILVLMSTYNGEKYIEQQIESIMHQTIVNSITLRIRDDGSTDNTCKVIERLQEEYADKINLIRGQNKGCNASFFELINGVNIADGYDYYSLSDQDDVWLNCKVEESVKVLDTENNELPLLYASTSYLAYDDMKIYGQTRRKQRKFSIYNTAIQNICPGHTQVFNNALLKIIQDKNIDIRRIYVYDSWIMSHAMLYGKILFDNSSYTYYRQHKDNQLGSGVGKIGQLCESIKRKNTGDGHKYRRQVEYLVEKNEDKMKEIGAYEEFAKFLSADTLIKKIKYFFCGRLYRQNKMETLFFRIGLVCGHY